MGLWIRAALAACAMLFATGAAAKADDRAYAQRMPTANQVIAAYPDVYQQYSACSAMLEALKLMIGTRYYRENQRSAVEIARDREYGRCITARVPKGTPAERRAYSAGLNKYSNDAFRDQVWDRFFPAQDRATLNQRLAADTARWGAQAERDKVKQADMLNSGSGIGELLSRFWYFGLLAILGVWGIFRFLRWLKPLRYTVGDTHFYSGGHRINIYENSGVLAGVQKETHTTHTPGTETRNQYGAVIHSTAGSTSTTEYQTVYIIDETGQEHASTLVNWSPTARPGNIVSVMWSVREGKKSGSIFQFINFTLDKSWTRRAALRQMLGMGWPTGLMLFFGLSALIGIALTLIVMLLAAIGENQTMLVMLGGPLAWLSVLALLLFAWFVRRSRIAQFEREVLPSIVAIARRNADAAAARNLGPISRAD